jgi:hypothetical protein
VSACGAVYSRQGEMATYGVTLAPCARPANHAGLCAFEARQDAPTLCPRCHHPEHGSKTCLQTFLLRNVAGVPRLPCSQCGPGAEAQDQEGAPS